MDAVKYLKEAYRMCNSMEECFNCPLKGRDLTFPCKGTKASAEYKDTEKCVAVVEKWSAEHPVKTRQSEFLKMFPNADMKNGIIQICPKKLDQNSVTREECSRSGCFECRKKYWLAEVE